MEATPEEEQPGDIFAARIRIPLPKALQEKAGRLSEALGSKCAAKLMRSRDGKILVSVKLPLDDLEAALATVREHFGAS